LLGAERDRRFFFFFFFYGVVPASAVFYSANYCETMELTATFNPRDSPGAAKLTPPRYQIERRNVQLDIHMRAYRRAVRREDKHSA
jgi:hypothetical protein